MYLYLVTRRRRNTAVVSPVIPNKWCVHPDVLLCDNLAGTYSNPSWQAWVT